MDSLFGMEVPGAARFIIAFVVVLVLIALTAWLVRRFGSGGLASAAGRGRQPRLAVIDAATVDARRKLILVRRDNVEHLVMIGGPTDVVIEPNIVRAAAAAREPAAPRTAPIPETTARPVPIEEATTWPLAPEPALRPQRLEPQPPAAAPWSGSPARPNAAARAPAPDTLAELAEVLAPRTPPHAEHEPAFAPAPEPRAGYATPANDQQLAEMAQRLEAVLRRPSGAEPHVDAPMSPPPAAETVVAHYVAMDARIEEHPPQPRTNDKKIQTIEQEMASLLGRPTGKT